nr:PREDICTED: probable peroxisomal acyl-coenzyme A oxidase 1 [Bemisia tabaci]
MGSITINKDLLRERQSCTFNVLELTHLWDGGPEKTKERKELEKFFLDDPELQEKIPSEYLSHKEKYQEALRRSCLLFKKIKEWSDTTGCGSQMDTFQNILGGMLGSAILPDGVPFALNYVMFLPTVMGQGTMQQQAYWVSRAWNCEIMCTYAQTELGHGTFIRGLETTATYDPSTEEFVFNSPTLTSYKWWPGGLGHTCNYAVVVAQLYTKGQCHGIHPFIVQLRDEETHMPLPGIKIGEIGSKLGMNTINNGYLGFENVRIPRENMLMKNSKVLPDGTYVNSPSDKLTYGTMIFVRVALVRGIAAAYLSKALTIATRYSALRKQGEIKPGAGETQILEYRTQQHKLFPPMAMCFAMRCSADWLWDIYNSVTAELDRGDLERLPELHAMACCLKAVCTKDSAKAIEVCRLATGGHGYMNSSNFPSTYGMVTAAETYEGENTVLLLQTARFLVKAWQQARSGGNLTETVEYLKTMPLQPLSLWVNSLQHLGIAFKRVAAGNIETCATSIERRILVGVAPEDAWNEVSIQLAKAAETHCRAFMMQIFINFATSAQVSPELKKVLIELCELYGTYFLLDNLGDFFMYAGLRSSDVPSIQEWLETLLHKIRPNAVGIVDGFDISDAVLRSALGAYDGNVYERLFAEANKSPLNAEPVDESFHKYLKPFLKSNL